MPPKKSNNTTIILALLFLVFALLGGFAFGAAQYDAATYPSGEEPGFSYIMAQFEVHLSEPFDDFWMYVQTEQVWKAVLVSLFIWFLVVAYIATNKKNFIHGKTYGSARWGTKNDIKDLFSENIMREKIRKAKALRWPWGRYAEYRRKKKECREQANVLRDLQLEDLNAEISLAKSQATVNGESFDKRPYEERRKKIIQEAKERYELLYLYAWKPAKIKLEYAQEVQQIQSEYQKGITIAGDAEYKKALADAKKKRDTELRTFWSVKRRVAKIKQDYVNSDAILTQTERICLENYKVNNHVLIVGGSGAGKTRGFVMPNILSTAGKTSFVITDPKGEILEKSYYFLSEIKGYKVRVLNLDDMASSDGYNPFHYIHPERPGYEGRVANLIDAIIINTDGGEKKGGSDPFWDRAEKLFLQALFFFTCDGFPEEEQTIETVLKLMSMLQIAEDSDNYDSDLDYFARILEERLNEADEENHNAGTMNIGIQAYKEFRGKASGKTAKSIVITAVARLDPFRIKDVRRIFSYDTMELDRLGEEKMALFVVVPPTVDNFSFIAGMLFTQIFAELQYCAAQVHKHEGQKLPVQVRFILDEFKNTCKIPNFLRILAYARSFGVGIVPILQSIDQLKEMYKDEWGTIVDNCSSTLFLGSISNPEALEFFSKMTGKGTFDKKTTSQSKGRNGSFTASYDEVGRELMDTVELRTLDKQKCLLFVAGRYPFYSDKYDYTKHPYYRFTSDGNKANSVPYAPQPSPFLKQKQLEEQIKDEEQKKDHRDRELKEAVQKRMEATLERINKTVPFIEVTTDMQSVLSFVSRNYKHMGIVSNDLLVAENGEPGIEDREVSLIFEEDSALDLITSSAYEERQERLRKALAAAEEDVEQNGIELVSPKETLLSLLSGGRNIEPVINEMLTVETGEPEEEIGILFDDEEDGELLAQDIGDLAAFLDEELPYLAD